MGPGFESLRVYEEDNQKVILFLFIVLAAFSFSLYLWNDTLSIKQSTQGDDYLTIGKIKQEPLYA